MKIQLDTWLNELSSKLGSEYVWGSKGPDTFDCSGLIYSTLVELGAPSDTPMGSWHQQNWMTEIPVEQAIKTEGALLYYPKTKDRVAHIAVSLGNGKTIEARNPESGVGSWSSENRGWAKGGLVPVIEYTKPKAINKEAEMARMCNPAVGKVSSEYGWRPRINQWIPSMFHAGIDIANDVGTPIWAAYGGVVVSAGPSNVPGRSGNHILIRNPDGESQYYGHLHKVRVAVGESVVAGQHIGDMGATGNVTGSHLHFECWNSHRSNDVRNPRKDFNSHAVIPGVGIPIAAVRKDAVYYDRQIDGVRGRYQILAEQQFLADRGEYKREVDGVDGYWHKRAWQTWLSPNWYSGKIDGKFEVMSIKSLQRWLQHLGYYKGVIDGLWGPMLNTAIQMMLSKTVKR